MWRLTPARRRGFEFLDDRAIPSAARDRSMADVSRANTLLGGTRSAIRAFRSVLPHVPRASVLLDVGTGFGDIPARATAEARRAGVALSTIGLDAVETLFRTARARLSAAVVADAMRLPLENDSVEIVICSQLLHHFDAADARRMIAELHRVARGWVIISDLERSWFAAGGFWLASIVLRFHPMTRHDGVTSVLRGFTSAELEGLVRDVTGATPTIRRGAFWRLSATWRKADAASAPRDAVLAIDL